jgi:hypothetical protein
MPIYTYQHPKTGKTIDICQSMIEEHVYVDDNGTKWNRVFYPVTFAFDTKLDPHDAKAFVKKTDKGGTIGDIMDLSKEMSEKRGGDKNDEIKVKYSKNREKKLNDCRLSNLKEERKKQFEEFKKLDKSKIKIKKKSSSVKKTR